MLGQFLREVHSDLSGQCNVGGATLRMHVCDFDLVVVSNRFLNIFNGDQTIDDLELISQHALRNINGNFARRRRLKLLISDDLLKGAFEFANIGFKALGNKGSYFIREIDAHGLRLIEQNGCAHLKFRRFNSDGQPLGKAGNQARLDILESARISI